MNTLPAPKPRVVGLEVSDPLEQFLAGQLSRRTRTAYRADLRDFFAHLGLQTGDLEAVRRIGFQDVVGYRNHLAGQGLRRTSINRKLSSLRAFFRMLVAAGYLEKNPADPALVRGYKIDDTLTGKAISTKALKSIVQSIEAEEDELAKSRDLAVFHLLVLGGLRRSEAARVSWRDIVEEGVFHVLRLPETKSGVSQEIKLQPLVMHYLGAYRQTLERHGYPTDGSVFISLSRNRHGKPLTDQSINLIVKRHALRAGVPRSVTAHMFRHTCCTLAIEGGARPQQVQAHLRHKDLKTTMRYYENRERLVDNASDYIHLG